MTNSKDTLAQIKDITKGYKLLNTSDKSIIHMSQRRLRHCQTCVLFTDSSVCNPKKSGPNVKTGKITSGCGCYMPSKSKMKAKQCPLSKW